MNADLKITDSNSGFIDILGEDAKEIDEIIPGLIGANAKSLLPEEIFLQLEYVLKNSQDIMNKDFDYNGRFINVSIFSLIENQGAKRDEKIPNSLRLDGVYYCFYPFV
mgnify:CR=1 FL=1